MALALSVRKNGDDYVLVEHAGETMRIAVNDRPDNRSKAVIILMADDDSGQAPAETWRLRSKATRERDDGA